jgi:microcystin degradation protein MlrC
MKIVICALRQETNTLNPVMTLKEDFDIAVGYAMLEKVSISALFEEYDLEIIPTLYANAFPGGKLREQDYLEIVEDILEAFPNNGFDGIWLYLHGAMDVENIGSGETYLLKRIREKVGFNVPIAAAFDFHANNTDAIISLVNIMCGYRTAPHRDKEETEQRALRMLIECIKKGILPRPQIARANVIVPGDSVQTDLPPLNAIMEAAAEMEKLPGMICVSVFNGQPWVDQPHMGPNMVVTHASNTVLASECAKKLAKMFYDARYDFKFLVEDYEPEDAIRFAISATESTVFISDSGDNTTAGAIGDNAYMLNRLIAMRTENALLGGITDKTAVEIGFAAKVGDTLTLEIGGSLDRKSEKANICGKLRFKGEVIGPTLDYYFVSRAIVLEVGGITIIVTEKRTAFVSAEMFSSVGIDILSFKIVVVKLGYLHPDLACVAPRTILAYTPGSSTERLRDMGHKNIPRPMFPLDDNFM